jgi:uncharacterized membrane protein (UPF0127 family)
MGTSLKWALVAALGAGTAGFLVYQDGASSSAVGAPRVSAAGLPLEKVTIAGKAHDLEVAATTEAVQRGLSKRATVPEGTGMVFVFPDSRILDFWMIDCLTDIDVAYLDRNGKVVSVYTMKAEAPQRADESREAYKARLTRYPSADDAMFAIELQAGAFGKLGVKPGDRIAVDYRKLRTYLR